MLARWLVVTAACLGMVSSCFTCNKCSAPSCSLNKCNSGSCFSKQIKSGLFSNKCFDLFGKINKSKKYEWVGVNMRFPSDSTRNLLESSGLHVPRNLIPTRFQVHPLTNEVYIAMPRYKTGTAITLAKAKIKFGNCIPTFHPYPCFELQEKGNCKAIQSAIDIVFDKWGRLWVLDSGVTNTLDKPKRQCPPKIVVISTLTHKVERVIDLSGLTDSYSRVQYLVLDESVLGQTYIYISDAASRSILVWDVYADNGWKILLPSVILNGAKDVLYLALVQHKDATTYLYFTYLSSSRMYYINSDFLQRRTTEGTIIDLGKKPKQFILLGSDKGTKLFFRFQGDGYIYQWNTLDCFNEDNFALVHEGLSCRLATHVAPGFKNIMYGIETNFYDYVEDIQGCIGPSISLFPLVKTIDKSSIIEPLFSPKESFLDTIFEPKCIF